MVKVVREEVGLVALRHSGALIREFDHRRVFSAMASAFSDAENQQSQRLWVLILSSSEDVLHGSLDRQSRSLFQS